MIEPIIEKTKLGELQFLINQINNGRLYHDLPFDLEKQGIIIDYIRKDCQERIDLISSHYDFKNKWGLDLGCYIGGITFRLNLLGAVTLGIESGPDAIKLAEAIAAMYQPETKFNLCSIESYFDNFSSVNNNPHDFCVYFGTFMWVIYHQGLKIASRNLSKISNFFEVMFFESSIGDGIAGPVMLELGLNTTENLISFIIENSKFTQVKSLGKISWGNRDILMFMR